MNEQTMPMIILIAGPYRSGTNDEPERMLKNLQDLEAHAIDVFRAGHIPMIGEWVALPIIRNAGSEQVGDSAYEQFLYPVAARLLERCDAVLRIDGASKGADEDVRLAKLRGLPVYTSAGEIPVRLSASDRESN